jgi:hypothetical protein
MAGGTCCPPPPLSSCSLSFLCPTSRQALTNEERHVVQVEVIRLSTWESPSRRHVDISADAVAPHFASLAFTKRHAEASWNVPTARPETHTEIHGRDLEACAIPLLPRPPPPPLRFPGAPASAASTAPRGRVRSSPSPASSDSSAQAESGSADAGAAEGRPGRAASSPWFGARGVAVPTSAGDSCTGPPWKQQEERRAAAGTPASRRVSGSGALCSVRRISSCPEPGAGAELLARRSLADEAIALLRGVCESLPPALSLRLTLVSVSPSHSRPALASVSLSSRTRSHCRCPPHLPLCPGSKGLHVVCWEGRCRPPLPCGARRGAQEHGSGDRMRHGPQREATPARRPPAAAALIAHGRRFREEGAAPARAALCGFRRMGRLGPPDPPSSPRDATRDPAAAEPAEPHPAPPRGRRAAPRGEERGERPASIPHPPRARAAGGARKPPLGPPRDQIRPLPPGSPREAFGQLVLRGRQPQSLQLQSLQMKLARARAPVPAGVFLRTPRSARGGGAPTPRAPRRVARGPTPQSPYASAPHPRGSSCDGFPFPGSPWEGGMAGWGGHTRRAVALGRGGGTAEPALTVLGAARARSGAGSPEGAEAAAVSALVAISAAARQEERRAAAGTPASRRVSGSGALCSVRRISSCPEPRTEVACAPVVPSRAQ